MKYRRLSDAQLKSFEKEFVQFLVINGITAEDWGKMKSDEPDHAEKMIGLFSDVVFEGILRKTEFIEWRSKEEIRTFHCLADKMVLVGLKGDTGAGVDFLDPVFIEQAVEDPPTGIRAYTTDKPYAKRREEEIFDMLENGCVISDGKLYKAIASTL